MELTPQNVQHIFNECLFQDGENTDNKIEAQAINFTVGFHPERLKYNEDTIDAFLQQLPEEFAEGWSFQNMCLDKDGYLWSGEHQTMQLLVVLGIAAGKLAYLVPREQWHLLPGGMPYLIKKIKIIAMYLCKENEVYKREREVQFTLKEVITFKIPQIYIYQKEEYDWYMTVALEKVDKVIQDRHLLTSDLIISYRNAIREGYQHDLDPALRNQYDYPRNRNTVTGIKNYIDKINKSSQQNFD